MDPFFPEAPLGGLFAFRWAGKMMDTQGGPRNDFANGLLVIMGTHKEEALDALNEASLN